MASPARRLVPHPPLPPHVRRGAGRGDDVPSNAATAAAARAAAPSPWSRDALAGRLVELSDTGGGAPLTMAVALVLDAQRRRETVAWITTRESVFFPPDVAESGVDLDALAVIRLPPPEAWEEASRARGGRGTATAARTTSSRTVSAARTATTAAPRAGDHLAAAAAARAADRILRSGAFGLVVLDLGRGDVTVGAQARLLGLAERHDAAVLCLTEKPAPAPSLSSLVSLRAGTERRRDGEGVFVCTLAALKDKRQPPGWSVEEVRRGPAGLR